MRRRVEEILPFVLLGVPLLLLVQQLACGPGVPGTVASLLAGAVALLNVLKHKLFPFHLEVSLTDPRFEPFAPGSGCAVMILPTVFLNQGYTAGVVKDVYVEMHHESGKKICFYPVEQRDSAADGGRRDLKALGRPFKPFPILAQGSVSVDLVLVPRDANRNYLQPTATLEEGSYVCELQVETHRSKPKVYARVKTALTREDLIALAMQCG